MKPDQLKKPDKLDPGQEHYDKLFNGITGSPDNTALDYEAERAAANAENFYSDDPERRRLAELENGKGLIDQSAGQAEAASLGASASKPKPFLGFAKGSVKKKAALALGGTIGVGSIVVIAFMLFMLVSGFGIGQVAQVMKNYEYARFYSETYRSIGRLFEADSGVKANPELGLSDVEPSSSVAKLRGFDAAKYVSNLEGSGTVEGIVSYESEGGKVQKVRIKSPSGEDIVLDAPKEGFFKTGERVEFSQKFKSALSDAWPELKEVGLVNKTTNALFERIGVKRYRWEKLAEKFKGKNGEEAFKESQKESYDRTRGSPDNQKASLDSQQKTDDSVSEKVKSNIDEGVSQPVEKAQTADVASLKERISSAELANKIGGGVIAGFFIACTADQLGNSYQTTQEQNTVSMQRSAALTQSAYDQYKAGATNAAAVGAETKLNAGFNGQAQYLKDSYNADWQNGENLPETAYPQRSPNGFLETFISVGDAASIAWETAGKTSVGFGSFGLTVLPAIFGHGPLSWSFTELCQSLTKPEVAIPVGLASLAATIIAAIPSAGGSVAATGTGEAAAEGLAIETTELVAQKTTYQLIKGFLTAPKQAITDSLEKTVAGRITLAISRFGAENSAFYGMALLMENVAAVDTHNQCSGTSDAERYNCSAAGANLMQSNLERTNNFGRPLSTPEVASLTNQQHLDHIASVKRGSFASRFLKPSNPYSAVSQVAVNLPTNTQGLRESLTTGYASNILHYGNPLAFIAQTLPFSGQNDKVFAASDADTELANMGIQQAGYSQDEQAKIDGAKDGYSMVEIAQWAKRNNNRVSELDSEYMGCFDAGKEWYQLDDKCKDPKNFSSDEMLKWRLYHRDALTVDDAIDKQTVTADSASSSTSDSSNGIVLAAGDRKALVDQIIGSPNWQPQNPGAVNGDLRNGIATDTLVQAIATIVKSNPDIRFTPSVIKTDHPPGGDHGAGKAIDLAGSQDNPEDARKLYIFLYKNYKALNVSALIFQPLPPGTSLVGGGKDVGADYYEGYLQDHYSHIHMGVN